MDALLAGSGGLLSPPLGQWLLKKNSITADQLQDALEEQHRSGTRLGEILIMRGILSPLNLYVTLAEQKEARLIDLSLQPPDPDLAEPALLPLYLAHRMIPWRKEEGKLVIAAAEPDDPVVREITHRFGRNCRIALATPRDIREAVQRLFARRIEEEARFGLWRRMPERSARMRFRLGRYLFFAILFEIIAATCFFPHIGIPLIIGAAGFLFAGTLLFKMVLFSIGDMLIHSQQQVEVVDEEVTDFPVYSILVPLYHEEKSISGLLKALRTLDYPKEKLDVKLVVEADDVMTIDAIKAAKPEPYFEIIRVPPSHPRTKPKACNYALRFARGTYLTIYDAEDRPEPDQLKKAVAMFRRSPPDVICLQARLNYYNRKENLLTRLFAIEYGTLFDFLLPALYHMHIPIPLGGTSNHIALEALRNMGAWDPYNVTEDADLGIRLAALGYRTMPLDSQTLEEAPLDLRAWLLQRSRWIKGYLQTWLVYMRHPVSLHRTFGATGFWGMQFFIGGSSMVYVAAPFLWLLSLFWLLGLLPVQVHLREPWVELSYVVLILGILLQWWMAFRTVEHRHWRTMGIAVALFPFYWVLHSIASARALWQLFLKPYHWDKTEHGLTKMTVAEANSA
ncbi:MAG: glycosyltransferase [Rickettsiales bacterium]